ncbi:MAG: hypothetical protein V3T24_02285, partial [Longimicrobiales bacterium]
ESGHVGEIHLIMNRTHDLAQGRESARRVLATAREHLGRNVHSLDCVPEDPAVARSVQRRRPVVLDRPDSPAASSLRTIAQGLFDGAAPHGNTLSAFFSTAKALIAPRRRSTRSSCAL